MPKLNPAQQMAKKRWAGVSKEERSRQMSAVAKARKRGPAASSAAEPVKSRRSRGADASGVLSSDKPQARNKRAQATGGKKKAGVTPRGKGKRD